MTSGTITTAPSSGNDIVNKTYADSIAAGINFHQSCRLATIAALPSCTYNNGSSGVGATLTATANGALSVDSTAVAATNRILVKNQVNQAHNGVYVVTQTGSAGAPFILTRATDFNTPGTGVNQIDAGDFFLITAGSTLANTSWVQQTPLPITMGTTAIVFSQFGAPLVYSAGTGLTESPSYTFNIANTGVSSGSYGGAATAVTLSINAQGQITSAADAPIAISGSQITSGTIGSSYLSGSYTGITGVGTLASPLVVSVNSASDAVRITQIGAGNAILVEDSANPDATPFVVAADGRVLIGATTGYAGIFNQAFLQAHAVGGNGAIDALRYSADAFGPDLGFLKSRSATTGTQAIVLSGDTLGSIRFGGSDGTAFIRGAEIQAAVDGTPGTNDMPGRLVFSTTADGASSPTERMRISSDGNVGIGAAAGAQYTLRAAKNITGGTFAAAFACDAIVQADVTARADYYVSSVACAAGTYGLINGFQAQQGTFTGTVTAQNGYRAAANLIGATTNIAFKAEDTAGVTAGKTAYGFFSAVNTATGGGTTYGFYAAGTANNYFGGPTTISVNSSSDALRITQVGAGNALLVEDSANPDSTPLAVDANGVLIVGNTASQGTVPVGDGARYTPQIQMQGIAYGTSSISATLFNSAASTGGGSLALNKSNTNTLGAQAVVASGDIIGTIFFNGSDGTNFVRGAQIQAAVDGTPGTNDMPGRLVFSTTADGTATPVERMRIDNAGNVGIGTSSPSTKLQVSGTITATAYAGINGGTF
jgi:hypothetical protein